jgi:hypothetical protein
LPILVSDTSVIIDLERGALLEALFQLPFEFAVPDLLFETELSGELGNHLCTLGLIVEELHPVEVLRATAIGRERIELSTQDSFAYALAEQRHWPLLTGDGALRQIAAANDVDVHGVLWVCDNFEQHAVIGLNQLHAGLTAISDHPRCRLPAAEVAIRLNRYAGA